MTNIKDYLKYVRIELRTINQLDAIASYDTGYGIHIVNEKLGSEAHCLDVIGCSILKLKAPKIDDMEQWEQAWDQAVALINKYIAEAEKLRSKSKV